MVGVNVKVWVAALGLATALMAALAAQAMAQYPPVRGNVVLSAGAGNLALGGRTTINATVVDEAGHAVAGLSCTFSVARQPGNDASVGHGPFTTDATGRVSTTLNVGSAVGTVIVEATCGELSAAVSVVASCPQTPAAPPTSLPGTGAGAGFSAAVAGCPQTPAAPPASLPETGAGGGSGGAGLAAWALVAAAAVVGVSGACFAWRRRKA